MAFQSTEPATLWKYLREGISSIKRDSDGAVSDFPPDLSDREAARELLDRLARIGIGHSTPPGPLVPSISTLAILPTEQEFVRAPEADRTSNESIGGRGVDVSFLGRLGAGDNDELTITGISDVGTLVAVLLAGSIAQRRAALRRLARRLHDRREISAEDLRLGTEAIERSRDVELAFHLSEVRRLLPGPSGRKARAEHESCMKLAELVHQHAIDFWAGIRSDDPILSLPGDDRALLLLHLPDVHTAIAQHVSAIIEGGDGSSLEDARSALVRSLRYTTDARLLPPLLSLIDGAHGEMLIGAARALGNIDDARIHPALAARFDREVDVRARLALAGALGVLGDSRGIQEVRHTLSKDNSDYTIDALDALESLGAQEDAPLLVALLNESSVALTAQALRTIGRLGDGRVLDDLSAFYSNSKIPAIRALAEDALAAIAARMELRGESTPTHDWRRLNDDALLHVEPRDRLGTRILGWRHYFMAHMWQGLGRIKRAAARYELAAKHRPDWSAPLIAMGLLYARHEQYSLALPAFRRALEVNRWKVERNPLLARTVARAFLLRAEQARREGQPEIAQGLVGEALLLDLRRAPTALRAELRRLSESLARGEEVTGVSARI